jgi:hypothetical protein
MAWNRPIWMQATGGDPQIQYAAQELRQILSGIFISEGVIGAANSCQVTQRGAGANFSVDIQAGYFMAQGDDVSNQGMYIIRAPTVENLVTPTAPGSGTRVHRVVGQIRDKLHLGSWTTYDAVPLLLQDTGSGTPAIPNSALGLGLVSIAAGQVSVQTAHITDTRINARVASSLFAPIEASSGTNVTTTSASFVALSSPLALTFIAPSSGAVWINLDSSLECVAGQWALFGFEIRNNNISGSVFKAAADNDSVQMQGADFGFFGRRIYVSGLTPGNTYFVRDMGKSSNAGDTASFFYRKITVEAVA